MFGIWLERWLERWLKYVWIDRLRDCRRDCWRKIWLGDGREMVLDIYSERWLVDGWRYD